jgi:hypothetical protein
VVVEEVTVVVVFGFMPEIETVSICDDFLEEVWENSTDLR